MEEKKVDIFLRDLSLNSEYHFLEEGKDKDEIKSVCEKRGVAFPSPDLAIMKMVYAYVNRTNLNGCSLPKEEVKKSLSTVVGKAIDFDHLRSRVVGWLLDADLVGNQIIAYGAFFKSSLEQDFELIKSLFDNKNLAVSFEAYGTREFNKDGTYNLKDICFAGVGLLINTKPAFPGAGVTEMANKRILEIASVEDKKTFIVEKSKLDILIDTLEDETEIATKLSSKDRNSLDDSDFAVVITKKGKDGKTTKIRKFPIHDESHVRNALSRLAQSKVKEDLSKLGVNITTVKRKILAKAKKFGMKNLLDSEKAQFRSPEMDTIHRLMGEVNCPMCNSKGTVDIDKIDFPQNKVEGKCWMCSSKLGIALTPDATFMPDESIPDDNLTNSSIQVTLIKENSMKNEDVIKTEGDGSIQLAGKDELITADASDTVVADDTTTDVNTDAPTINCPSCGSSTTENKIANGPFGPAGIPTKDQTNVAPKAKVTKSAKEIADSRHLVPSAEGKICCATCGNFVTSDAIKLAKEQADANKLASNPTGTTGDGGDPSTLVKVLTDTKKPSGNGIPANKEHNITSDPGPTKNADNFATDLNKADSSKLSDLPSQNQLDDLKTLADIYNKFPKPKSDGKTASTVTASMVIEQIEFLKANARDEGKKIGLRRSLLGDFAKDMSDDDVLDETKFENASLKKEIADLKAGKTVVKETATVISKKETTPLEIGSKDNETTQGSEISALAKKVRKTAFNI